MNAEVCGLVEASCTCYRPKGHRKPHRCECKGAWWFDRKGEFVLVRIPTKYVGDGDEDAAIAELLGILFR